MLSEADADNDEDPLEEQSSATECIGIGDVGVPTHSPKHQSKVNK